MARPPYLREFKQQIVALHRAGRTPAELAKEFEPTEESIRAWIKQAERDDGLRDDGLMTAEEEEFARIRRENHQLRIEREFLYEAWPGSFGGPSRCHQVFRFVSPSIDRPAPSTRLTRCDRSQSTTR